MAEHPLLLIRADASSHIGTGHVMRSLALAQAWHATPGGGTVQFAFASVTPALQARLSAEGFDTVQVSAPPGSVLDAKQTIATAEEMGAGWVVVDGYHFDAAYQQAIKASGLQLLFVDDYGHAAHYWADLVLNQNIYADESLYPSRESTTKLLLGTRYALLRREFWPWRGWQREIPATAHKVLVTMGGTDPDNVTLTVLKALQQIQVKGMEVKVVVGGSNPHRESLKETLRVLETGKVLLVENTPNMPELMAWADVAISAAGSTCWELAFMQLPSLLLVLADNQRLNAAGLDAAGVALNLGWYVDACSTEWAHALERLLTNQETRAAMAHKGRLLVDGEGECRVAGLLSKAPLRIRPASEGDQEMLFQWANDALTRRMSFRSDPIHWEDHVQWLRQACSDPDALFVIAEWWREGRWVPVGSVRISGDGTVSISVAPEYRGRRLALPALQAAIACYGARFPSKMLTACVKPENRPSHRIFQQMGFECVSQEEVLGQTCQRYVFRPARPSGIRKD